MSDDIPYTFLVMNECLGHGVKCIQSFGMIPAMQVQPQNARFDLFSPRRQSKACQSGALLTLPKPASRTPQYLPSKAPAVQAPRNVLPISHISPSSCN